MARQYYHNEQGATDVTVISNVTWSDVVSLTFTPDASTSYYLFFSGLIGNSVTSSDVQYQVLEGANVIASGNWEPKDTSPQEYQAFAGFLRHTEGGSPISRTFKIQIKLETSGPTARCRSGNLTAIRHETGDVFEETTAAYTSGNATGASVESIATSGGANYQTDSYIFFACAKLQAGTVGEAISVQLDRPASDFSIQPSFAMAEYSDTTSAVHKMLGFHVAANASHDLNGGSLVLRATTPPGTTSVSDRRILALKVTGDNVYSNYDATGGSGGTTSYVDQVTYTPTIAVATDHLAFLSSSWNANSSTVSGYNDFTIAGTVFTEMVKEFSGDSDTHMAVGTLSLASGSNAIKNRVKGESAISIFSYDQSFVVWQLGASVTNTTLTATGGSFALSGQAIALVDRFVCTPASYALAGQDSSYIAAQALSADVAAFTVSGEAVIFAGNLSAGAGAFALSGEAALLSSKLFAEAAGFTFSGQAVDFLQAVLLTASPATFTLSGQAALFAERLVADVAAFSLSGQIIGQAWPAAASAFTLSGQAALFAANVRIGAATFALNGQASNQAWAAGAGAFTLAGQDVILRTAIGLIASGASFLVAAKPIWSTFAPDHPGEFAVAEGAVAEFPGEGQIAIATTGAAFTLAGQALTFRQTLVCSVGAFTLTGNAANQSWSASAAAFTLSGQAALFVDRLAISAGAFVLAGQPIGQAWANGAASFAVTGIAVSFTEARLAEAAAFTIGAVDVHFLDLEVATFALTGADVPFSTVLAASSGAFVLTGQAAEFLNVKLIEAEAGAFALSGQDIGFGRGVGIEAASFAVTPMTTPEVIRLLCSAASFGLAGQALAFNVAFHLATGAFVLRGVAIADVAGPSGDHTFLIEVQAHDGSSLQTFYLSKPVGFLSLPTDPTPNQFYDPRVLDAGNFKQVTGLPGENTVSTSAGNVVIANASPGDGTYLDDWLEMGFGGRSIVIRALPRGSKSLLSASVLLRARVDRLTSARPLEQIELTIRNKLSDLDRPLLTERFAGTTTSTGDSAEGNADLKDQIKQQVWGEAAQVLLQPANIYDLIYHASLVTDYSELVSITVSDSGVLLTYDGDSASIAALRAASIAAGHYRTCLAEGLVRLGSSPVGAVTADIVEGTSAADRTAAQIVRRQLLQFGVDLSEISDGSFDDLDSKNDAVCYSVVNDDRSAGEEMQAILNSIGGRLLPNSNDLFAVTRFEAPVASPTLDFDIETDVIADTLQRLEGSPVVYQVALGWGRVHHPQAEGQLAGSVTTERKAYLAKDLRTATQTDNSVKTKHLDARVISFETRLAYQADAEAEAQRILDLMKVERAEYSVTLPLSQGWAAQVGGSIVLRHPRLGLADGKAFTVLERSDVYAEEAVGLDRVWG